MANFPAFKSILGSLLGIGRGGELVSRQGGAIVQLTRPAVTASITISAEGASVANTRDITIQLRDCDGAALTYIEQFDIVVFSSSTMLDFVATGGSTGVQAGVSGKLLAIVAKKLFRCITTATGLWVGSYLDSGTDPAYLGIRLPGGQIIAGGLLTTA